MSQTTAVHEDPASPPSPGTILHGEPRCLPSSRTAPPGPRRLCYTRCYTGEQPRHQPQTSMSRPASDGKPPVPSWHWVRRVLDRRLVTDGNSSAVVRHARSAAGRLLGRDPILGSSRSRAIPAPCRRRRGQPRHARRPPSGIAGALRRRTLLRDDGIQIYTTCGPWARSGAWCARTSGVLLWRSSSPSIIRRSPPRSRGVGSACWLALTPEKRAVSPIHAGHQLDR